MWEKSNSEIQLQKDINKIGGLKFWDNFLVAII